MNQCSLPSVQCKKISSMWSAPHIFSNQTSPFPSELPQISHQYTAHSTEMKQDGQMLAFPKEASLTTQTRTHACQALDNACIGGD